MGSSGAIRLPWSKVRYVVAVVALAVFAAPLSLPVAAAQVVDPNWAPPRTVYIPETGQSVDRLFLDLWLSGGGTLSWGNPITPEFTEDDGQIVQYYEYARFEYWPDGDADGNYVVLGKIGAELQPLAIPRRAPGFSLGGGEADGAAANAAIELHAWAPIDSVQDIDLSGDSYRRDTYRFVPETGHGVWGGFRAFWEGTGEDAYLGNPLTEEYVQDGVHYQVFERGKLTWRPGGEIEMVPVGAILVERYGLDTAPTPQGDIPTYREELFIPPLVVPAAAAAPAPPSGYGKSIVISLSQQALWAYEGTRVVKSTYVSTGTERFRTPPGLFYVNSKIPVQDMSGVLGGEYYNVPRVPDVMYFTNRGHAIHGAYWHENFGTPMSHGCVNLPLDVATWLYSWTPIGTPVLIVA